MYDLLISLLEKMSGGNGAQKTQEIQHWNFRLEWGKGRPRGMLLGCLFSRRALKEEVDSKGNRDINLDVKLGSNGLAHSHSLTVNFDRQIILSEPVSLSIKVEPIPHFSVCLKIK